MFLPLQFRVVELHATARGHIVVIEQIARKEIDTGTDRVPPARFELPIDPGQFRALRLDQVINTTSEDNQQGFPAMMIAGAGKIGGLAKQANY